MLNVNAFLYYHVSRSALERMHRLFNKDNTFKIKSGDKTIKMYLPYHKDYIQNQIILTRQFFESEDLFKIREFVTPGMVFCDIGANIGNHTIYFAKILQARRVYTFEPQKILSGIVKKNISLNGLDHIVTFYDIGLGKTNGKSEIIYNGLEAGNLGETKLSESEKGEIEIRKLDDISIIEKIDFIKIDVEEMEGSVLQGAKDTILKNMPIMWIEIKPAHYKNVNSILTSYNYKKIKTLNRENFIFAPATN